MPLKLIEEVHCIDDGGERYVVHVLQEERTFQPIKGSAQKYGGKKTVRLAGSRDRVNVLDTEFNTFQVFKTNRVIRRIDSN